MGKRNKNYKNENNSKEKQYKRNSRRQINWNFNNKSNNRREEDEEFKQRRNGSKKSSSYSSNSYNRNNGKRFPKRERNNCQNENINKIEDYFGENHKKREKNNFKNKDDENELEIILKEKENSLNKKEHKKDKKDKKSQNDDDANNKLIEDLKEKNKKLEEIINDKSNEIDRMKIEISRKNEIIEEFQKKEEELNEQINLLLNDTNNAKNNCKDLIKKNKELENEIKQNNKIMEHIRKVNPLIIYMQPTLIGLNNIGATCFMNSTLQCLSQTKDLTNYFLNEKNKDRIINNNISIKNKNEYQLSPIFLELIQKLWEINGPNSFSPNTFMNTINNMNPLFKSGQAGDAKDFIIFVLEQLHKELKQSININFQDENGTLNQYDKNSAINYFLNDFKKECSIISDIFFGFNETTNECLYCKNIYNSKGLNGPICYNYGIFNCLIFPLEEVKNMKNMQNNFINNNIVTLYDCFYYNQKSDYFTGDNRNYCNVCKQLYDSIYISKIFVSPKILVIILNRGRGNIYDVKLDFNEIIDITQFVQQKDCPQLIYNLYGVITHIGQSGPNAHFIASCKSPIDNKWYRYNDAFVTPITNLQKDVIEFGTPYILFYQKNY